MAGQETEALDRAYGAILAEARAHVAAQRDPAVLEERIRAAGRRARAGGAEAAAVEKAERRALKQLQRVLSVHRARARLAREPQPPPVAASARSRRAPLRTRPTITGNMDVRRGGDGDAVLLAWDPAPAVVGWEVRFSERPDARSGYEVRETVTLPARATSVAVPLGERPLRVHLLGRARDGRLVRRAVISALTRDTWDDRWQRKASAS